MLRRGSLRLVLVRTVFSFDKERYSSFALEMLHAGSSKHDREVALGGTGSQ